MRNNEITIRATEHPSAHEAIQHLDVSDDDRAVLIDGKYLTLKQAEADRLAEAGVEFAYLFHHESTGRVMTVPVND
jgi:hypothetical protein